MGRSRLGHGRRVGVSGRTAHGAGEGKTRLELRALARNGLPRLQVGQVHAIRHGGPAGRGNDSATNFPMMKILKLPTCISDRYFPLRWCLVYRDRPPSKKKWGYQTVENTCIKIN